MLVPRASNVEPLVASHQLRDHLPHFANFLVISPSLSPRRATNLTLILTVVRRIVLVASRLIACGEALGSSWPGFMRDWFDIDLTMRV